MAVETPVAFQRRDTNVRQNSLDAIRGVIEEAVNQSGSHLQAEDLLWSLAGFAQAAERSQNIDTLNPLAIFNLVGAEKLWRAINGLAEGQPPPPHILSGNDMEQVYMFKRWLSLQFPSRAPASK